MPQIPKSLSALREKTETTEEKNEIIKNKRWR